MSLLRGCGVEALLNYLEGQGPQVVAHVEGHHDVVHVGRDEVGRLTDRHRPTTQRRCRQVK